MRLRSQPLFQWGRQQNPPILTLIPRALHSEHLGAIETEAQSGKCRKGHANTPSTNACCFYLPSSPLCGYSSPQNSFSSFSLNVFLDLQLHLLWKFQLNFLSRINSCLLLDPTGMRFKVYPVVLTATPYCQEFLAHLAL